jgi:hypothetical protein
VNNGILLAWLVGEGIIAYRAVTRDRRPPLPAELLASSGAFVLIALLGEAQPSLAVTLAVGLDIAAFMGLFDPKTAPKTGK